MSTGWPTVDEPMVKVSSSGLRLAEEDLCSLITAEDVVKAGPVIRVVQ